MIDPSFGKELRRAATEAAPGLVPRLVAEQPQEWRIGSLTIVVARGTAQLRYARQPIGRATAEADAVVAAWRRALITLTARSLDPDRFLPLLGAAYLAALGTRAPGERVELTALRAEIARLVRGHTRAQFAWDLARLQRERRLSLGGARIDLGVATGNAASHASRVVWVEDESGSGHYYQYFRTLAQEAR